MATATKARPFNYELFRKRVRLFDSDLAGERDTAIRQALGQCAESDPPVHFWEAAALAFGGVDGAERDELEERAARAEAEAAEQRDQAARNAEAAREQSEINARLREENARLEDALDRRADDGERRDWPEIGALQPTSLLLMFAFVLVCEWSAIAPLGHAWLGRSAWIVAEWIHALAIALFIVWSFAVYRREGLRELLFGWAAWGGIWVFAVWVIGLNLPGFTHKFLYRQMFVPYCWWATMGIAFRPGTIWIVFIALAVAVDLILGFPVSRWIVGMIIGAITLLKNWLECFADSEGK